MIKCNIKTNTSNEILVSLHVGDCHNCISNENAQNLIEKFKGSDIHVGIYKETLKVSMDYNEVIVDCHKENEKSQPITYKLKAV